MGVAGTLVAHVDLWIEVLALLGKIGDRVMVFHVYSHINLLGNDRADKLANEARLKSDLYANALPGQRPTKRLRPNPPDVADVELVLSSDEELELRYINARRQSLHLPPQPQRRPPVRGMTHPPQGTRLDFSRDSTPEPDPPQGFPM